MSDILKQMQREQIELLQQRVEELERERDEARADKNEWSRYHQQALFKEAQAVEALTAAEARERALQQRVEELEASLELRWADIAHLDTKLADTLDRAEAAEQAADAIGVTPHSDMRPFVEQAVKYALARIGQRHSASPHAVPAQEGGTNAPENEDGQCAEWPRCACGRGGPDLCAVPAALKDDSFFPENKERRPFGDKGLQREDQPPPLSPVATNLSAMDQEWE